ncbi:L,D-transpeptidase [Tomitella cavernea]|uniref:L,D-transpeptidase n=1 Tax=Tomitella cavernea TaxID=1387982 RepID=UPI0027DCC8AE|nr:Ig-like domain-containing protein [Tomitella cavernea]
MALVGATSACTIGGDSDSAAAPATPEKVAAEVEFAVPDGSAGVSPIEPVSLTVADGSLTGVTMTNPQGEKVEGELAPDGQSWTTAEYLGYGTTYTVQAQARGEAGPVTETAQFTTIQPDNLTAAYMLPFGGQTVGVGQPAVVQFDEPIPDRMAAQEAITVTADPPVEGAFYWVSNKEVHWRPKEYWQPGTDVTVDVNTYGKDLGGGLYGQEDTHATFTIGDSVIAVADDNTKMITISRNGEVIKSMPTSMGKNMFPTPNGTYIIGEKYDEIIMDSSTYGLPIDDPNGYKTPVEWATRMSYGGIFVHSAPWSVWAQGSQNTSHGCLNVSPANAKWFFDNFKRGDIVVVKNTVGGTLSGTEGLGDWNIPWEKWEAGNADVA